jgi:hypothetical protein
MLSFLIHILSQQQKIKDSLLTWFKTKKMFTNRNYSAILAALQITG